MLARQCTDADLIEAPGPAFVDDFKALFVVSIEQFVPDFASWVLVGQFDSFRAGPLRCRALGWWEIGVGAMAIRAGEILPHAALNSSLFDER
jgi:hypothetical protein